MTDAGTKAQKIDSNIQEVAKTARGCWNALQSITDRFTAMSVDRNGRISCLRGYAGNEKAPIELLVESVGNDRQTLNSLEGLGAELACLGGVIQELEAEFLAAWNERSSEFRRLKAVVQQREERLQAHAINNPEVRKHVWSITNGKCFYCDVELTEGRDETEPHRNFCVDHLVAKANGGPDHKSNYVPACFRCNTGKCATSYVEFVRKKNFAPMLKVVGGTDEEVA